MKKRRKKTRKPSLEATKRLLDIVHTLRQECPWDRKQTHRTLIPYLLEEAYETVDAIESRQSDLLREELGICCCRWYYTPSFAMKKGSSPSRMSRGLSETR